MSNVLVINAHHKSQVSAGQLNASLVELALEVLGERGHSTRLTIVDDGWDNAEELAKHQWADAVLLQMPVNWMGVPWPFKQYMDEVYTAGLSGELCDGDGRHRDAPEKQYGSGGTLTGKRYMMSLTFNAPEAAFDDPEQYLFEGRGVDDLLFPMHMNFRFFAMQPLPTFACFDVMKNADIDSDFARYREHLSAHF